jgi:hypothetical protein
MHKFAPDGKLLKTWGDFGDGPGQFALPHKLDVDSHGVVYVCDRNNDRIQLFDSEGEFIDMWTDFHWPHDIYIDRRNDIAYVVEAAVKTPYAPKVTIRDLKGKILSGWEGKESEGKGVLEICHGICVDSHGDIYIGEIVRNKRVQKFARIK